MKRAFRILIVLVALAAGAAWWIDRRIEMPFRGFSGDEVFVELPPGTGVAGIGARLAEAGVVPDAWTFRLAAMLEGQERHLKAGEYRFADPASPRDIIGRLVRGDVFSRSVTFPEGLTIREMGALFGKSGIGSAVEFEREAANVSLLSGVDPDARNLEGYLFPDTYALPRSAGAAGTILAMADRFKHVFEADVRPGLETSGLTAREVVILASIVEKETAAPDERPLVAAVYRNRLKIGMALQSDPTVIYALMQAGRWRGNLSRADLQIASPYNTYRYQGLPPGPIASPGRLSLVAALQPADVPYLYFVSRNDGTHVFARTLAEHNRNVREWQVQYFRNKTN